MILAFFLLFLLLFAGVGYVFYVVARILLGMLRRLSSRGQPSDVAASARDVEPRSTGTRSTFVPAFRQVHLFTLLAFDQVYGWLTFLAISPGDWVTWHSHPFRGILFVFLITFCGPFSTAIYQPYPEHWKTAWGLFPFCLAILLWGIFCQMVRLPFQRDPQRVAIVMFVIGLLGWFNGALFSLLMAA
jgi:hypothetical protein